MGTLPLLPSAVSIKVQSPPLGFTSVTTAPALREAISSGYSGSPWKLYWRTPLLRGETGCGREVYGGGGGALEPEQFEVSQRSTLCQQETFVYKMIDLLYFTSCMSYSFLLTICLITSIFLRFFFLSSSSKNFSHKHCVRMINKILLKKEQKLVIFH